MKYKLAVSLLSLCLGTCAWALPPKDSDKADNELQRATETIQHLASTEPDQGVPNTVFEGAKCVAVIPTFAKGAFVVGGEHGKGVATCRTGSGSWSSPAALPRSFCYRRRDGY
jgi:SH3 domain-containing YSC84-like protein 1